MSLHNFFSSETPAIATLSFSLCIFASLSGIAFRSIRLWRMRRRCWRVSQSCTRELLHRRRKLGWLLPGSSSQNSERKMVGEHLDLDFTFLQQLNLSFFFFLFLFFLFFSFFFLFPLQSSSGGSRNRMHTNSSTTFWMTLPRPWWKKRRAWSDRKTAMPAVTPFCLFLDCARIPLVHPSTTQPGGDVRDQNLTTTTN